MLHQVIKITLFIFGKRKTGSLFFEAHIEKAVNGIVTNPNVQPNGKVTILIKLPNSFVNAANGYIRKFQVVHFKDNGKVNYLPAKLMKINGEYYLRLTVSSFSLFAIVYKDEAIPVYNVPDTGTSGLSTLPYAIIIAGMSISAVILKKKREENK